MRILIVDDVGYNRMAIERMLDSSSHVIFSAKSGREALALMESDPDGIQLVITDLLMPDIDGVELLKETKQMVRYGGLGRLNIPPFVLVTACHDPEKLLAAGQAGFVSIISKPLNVQNIRDVVALIESGQYVMPDERTDDFEILVIDPVNAITFVIAPMVKGTQNRLHLAANLDEGIRCYQKNTGISVVISANQLGEETGLELIQRCHGIERFNDEGPVPSPPFILIADNEMRNDQIKQAIQAGFDDVLLPPFDQKRLEKTLSKLYFVEKKSPLVSQNTKQSVLIVDDIGFNRSFLERSLHGKGFHVVSSTCGRDALKNLLEGHQFDLVICDLMMPDIDGIQLIQEIQEAAAEDDGKLSQDKVTCPPFILMTSSQDSKRLQDAMAAGYHSIIRKPLDLPRLEQLMSECLEKREKQLT